MSKYEKYENLITDRLQDKAWDASILPSIAELNDPKVVSKPIIYVIFTGSTFDDTEHLGDFVQNEPLSFEVFITARFRHGENGVFSVADEVIKRLLKWEVPDATERISLNSFGYRDGIQPNWQYVLKFGFPTIRIMREELEDERLIRRIDTQDDRLLSSVQTQDFDTPF